MKRNWLLLVACALAGCAPRSNVATACPPCVTTAPPPDAAIASTDASTDAGKDASKDAGAGATRWPIEGVVVARDGDLAIVRRDGAPDDTFVALVGDGSAAPHETQLDGLVGEKTVVKLVDVDGDGLPDVLADRGTGTAESGRFSVYPSDGSRSGRFTGREDLLAWRFMIGATELDAVAKALVAARVDFSVPEACGAIDRSKPVEAWLKKAGTWTRQKAKAGTGWSCGALTKDGPSAYWMPELSCSKVVPGCIASLVSGGHGGTTRPDETYVFFGRVHHKLEVVAVGQPEL